MAAKIPWKDYPPHAWRLKCAVGFNMPNRPITVDSADVQALLDQLNYLEPPEPEAEDLV